MENKYIKELVIGICIVMVLIAMCPLMSNFTINKKAVEPDSVIVLLQQPEFLIEELSDSTLYLALKYYNIKCPNVVLAQAKLETGNYRSILCKIDNNIFGLYDSKAKKYMKFDHWSDCILAYQKYIESKYKDGEDYYKFLERINYAEDPEYTSKLKKYTVVKDTIKTTPKLKK